MIAIVPIAGDVKRNGDQRPAELVAQWRKSRRNFRTMASLLEHSSVGFAILTQSKSAHLRVLGEYCLREAPKIIREKRALADILDEWLRTDRMPSADEFDSYIRRVLQLTATWTPVADGLVKTLKPEDAP
jgi:hypothetical protein